jgi:PAS domain S-box-containing protein
MAITAAFILLFGLAGLVWIRKQNLELETEHLRRLVANLGRSQEAVRLSERRHREFVENAVNGIFHTNEAGRFLDVNPALVAMLGYTSKEEVLALNFGTDVCIDPSLGRRLRERTREGGRLKDIEVQWRRQDGTHLTVRLSGRVVPDSEEIECIVQDLTESRAMTRQIVALQKFETIGQLAGGIAHDFNNVVGAIQSWAELAREEAQPGSSLQHRLQRLCSQTGRAAALTRQMLAVSRRQASECRELFLNDVIHDVAGFLKNVMGSAIQVATFLAPDLESIYAEPTQMEQVVMNLMLNARDAMPHGGRLVIETKNQELDDAFCRVHRGAHPGQFACVSVTDTGCGMDPATQEHIFEPFFTTKDAARGTGLGLATVDGIVRQHRGLIHVQSELNRGTMFRVYFPVHARQQKECNAFVHSAPETNNRPIPEQSGILRQPQT